MKLAIVLTTLLGCAASDPTVEAPAGYDAQQKSCIARYQTKGAIDACRLQVMKAWSAADAGSDR